MPEGDLIEWFAALPAFTQIFFGLFLLLVAIPMATLIAFQFIETLRGLAGLRNSKRSATKNDRKKPR